MIYIVYDSERTPSNIMALVIQKYLKFKYNINSKLAGSNQLSNFKHDYKSIFVPISIESNTQLYKYRHKFKNMLVNNPDLVDMLNNKGKSVGLITKLKLPYIPTFTDGNAINMNLISFIKNQTENKFIIKNKNTMGSIDMYVLNKKELLEKIKNKTYKEDISKNYIVQPYLEKTEVYAMDCLCINGKIQYYIVNNAPPFFNNNSIIPNKYRNPTHTIIHSNHIHYNSIVSMTHSIVEHTAYNGFIEVEYIVDKHTNKLYFLEINPRISGNIFMIDNKNGLIFLEHLLFRYINLFSDIKYEPTITQQVVKKMNFYIILTITVSIVVIILILVIILS